MINLDVLVLGGGTSGEYAAAAAKQKSDSVGIVEKGVVGGDCVFHACIPTKALIEVARLYKKARAADYYGLPVLREVVTYPKVKTYKDKIVADMSRGSDKRLAKEGLKLFKGSARFVSPHEVAVADEIIKANKVIIATGSIPAVPPIPGLKEAGYITNVEALELEQVPQRLAIIGGGAVGVEFAQIFSAFGANVHIYEALDKVLFAEDEEVSRAMVELFGKQGIAVSTSVTVSKIQRNGSAKLVSIKTADGKQQDSEFDEILVATGRRPAIDDLNLAAAGVKYGKKGIPVDAALRTNVPHIWAAGDVTGTALFTLIAWEQDEAADANATSEKERKLSYEILPRATFCSPEVASVGWTEKQAREKGFRLKLGKFDIGNLSRAIVSGDTDGFIKVIAEEESGRILGGHIVGFEASLLIHELALAMAKGNHRQ